MVIDLIFAAVIIFAIVKGFQRGLVVAVFSLVGLVVGLAAALKLSVWVAGWLEGSVNVSSKWLPVISFVLVFVAVVLLVRLAANVVEASLNLAALGWVNKIGGAVMYIVLHSLIFSILLFFAIQVKLVKPEVVQDSVVYEYISPWGPWVMDGIGKAVPWFRDMFGELESFFESLPEKSNNPAPAN
jgi:membrane protein required for colicin V production